MRLLSITFVFTLTLSFSALGSPSPEAKHVDGIGLSKPCYSGLFNDYDRWREALISKKPKVEQLEAEQQFDARFPRDKYDTFKRNVHCYFFPYDIDGVSTTAFYVAPKDVSATQRLPVIIFNRGGNGPQGRWLFGSVMRTLMPLAKKGYIVLASNYRGSHQGRQAGGKNPGWDEFGGSDVNDVIALLDIVDGIPNADISNIFMAGYSRGGMMTYMAASKTNRLNAIASIAGISDLYAFEENRPELSEMLENRINYTSQTKEYEFNKRSALKWLGEQEYKVPLLLIHGQQDERVSVEQSISLAARLDAIAYPYELRLYEDGDHYLDPYWNEVIQDVARWFDKHRK